MPCEVLIPPRQFMNATAPSIAVYMAKLEGRYAVLEWKFPGLSVRAMTKNIPIRGFRVAAITLHIKVWHREQTNARIYRTK